MNLKTTGMVLGVREETRTNKSTGEVRTYRTLDLYDDRDGPCELSLRDDLVDLPPTGTRVDVKVAVRAYSGYVRDGHAGDARLQFSAVQVTVVEDSAVVKGFVSKAKADLALPA